jgi:hypothetical protein
MGAASWTAPTSWLAFSKRMIAIIQFERAFIERGLSGDCRVKRITAGKLLLAKKLPFPPG